MHRIHLFVEKAFFSPNPEMITDREKTLPVENVQKQNHDKCKL